MSGPPVRKVILAAGGTGGHMFPAEALAGELRARGVAVALVTDRRGGGFGGDLTQVETHLISAGGIAGGNPLKRVRGLGMLALGWLQARRLVAASNADAAVGFGGYASVPTVLAASRAGLRVVLHEQNAVAGRANRMLAGRADAIATGFAQARGLADADLAKTKMTGNPVRAEICEIARHPYPLPGGGDAINLLVIGGSLGAQVFNSVVPAAVQRLPEDLRARLRVTQQVPGEELDVVRQAYQACNVRAVLAGFFDDLPKRLAEAHLVISRAGASTVAELMSAGRPAVLVPYPHGVDDHQTANAQALADAGGGWLMPQAALTPDALAARLESLLTAPALLDRAAACAAALAPRDAAGRLADLVCGAANENGGEADARDLPEQNSREAAA